MAKEKLAEPSEPKMTLNLDEKMIKGIEDSNIDDKITVALNVKITEVGRDTYVKGEPIRVRAEVLSGKILDSKVKGDIKEAKNLKELTKAVESLPKED